MGVVVICHWTGDSNISVSSLSLVLDCSSKVEGLQNFNFYASFLHNSVTCDASLRSVFPQLSTRFVTLFSSWLGLNSLKWRNGLPSY